MGRSGLLNKPLPTFISERFRFPAKPRHCVVASCRDRTSRFFRRRREQSIPSEAMEMGDLSRWPSQSDRAIEDPFRVDGGGQPGRKPGFKAAIERFPGLTPGLGGPGPPGRYPAQTAWIIDKSVPIYTAKRQ